MGLLLVDCTRFDCGLIARFDGEIVIDCGGKKRMFCGFDGEVTIGHYLLRQALPPNHCSVIFCIENL
jgi:hypothetical protein